MSRIVVIGGGITGLVAAHRLRASAPDREVLLVEGSERCGGHVGSVREEGFVVEAGPNGFLARASEPEPLALVRELGLEGSLIEARDAARRRYVWRHKRLRVAPSSPLSLLSTDALSPAGKLRLAAEPFVRSRSVAGESVHAFASRRLGREVADALVDPAVSGISAGDSRELEAAAAFPALVEMERAHGSLLRAMMARKGMQPPQLVSLEGGMGVLTDALWRRLGSAVRLRSRVRWIGRADGHWQVFLDSGERVEAEAVVVATSAAQASTLLSSLDSELAGALSGFPQAGLAVVGMAFRESEMPRPLDGYGYLAAREAGLDTLGVVWESSLFAGRAPAGHVLLRAMLGGARKPEVAELDAPALLDRARRELATVLGVRARPARHWVWRWPNAITQYTRGHLDRVARARALLARHPGLELCGTSYDGVSFTAAIGSAERAAASVLVAPMVPAAPGSPRWSSLTSALRRETLPDDPATAIAVNAIHSGSMPRS